MSLNYSLFKNKQTKKKPYYSFGYIIQYLSDSLLGIQPLRSLLNKKQ